MTTQTNRLHKSRKNSMLFGVAGGMAEYFDIDTTLVRIAWVVFGLASAGIAIIAYVVLAAVIPPGDSQGRESVEAADGASSEGFRRTRQQRRRSLLAFVLIAIGVIVLAANFGLFGWWPAC